MTSNLWVAGAALLAYGTLWGIDEFAAPKGPTQASLKHLVYQDGLFTQEHSISGDGVLQMDWTAEINRGDRQLCSGSGTAPYQNETPKTFDADAWTGGDCPPLLPGDEALAVWEYFDDDGTRVRLSGLIVIGEVTE